MRQKTSFGSVRLLNSIAVPDSFIVTDKRGTKYLARINKQEFGNRHYSTQEGPQTEIQKRDIANALDYLNARKT